MDASSADPAAGTSDAPDPTSQSTLGRGAARGGIVVLSGQAARILIQVLSVSILARLLTPREYGLIAMVMAVIAVADIFRDFGLSAAAIQARVLTRAQQFNLFWINTGIGCLLAAIAFALAPVIAWVFDEPVLVPTTQVLAVAFVLNGMATQFRADLTRRMRFKHLVIADVSAPVLALIVAVPLAMNGAGHWALVAQQLTQYAIVLVMVAAFAGWMPRRPRRDVATSGFLRFGWTLVGTQLVGYVANNVDSLIIGTRFGATELGLYNRAFQLLMNPLNQVRSPATNVALPVLSRIQDDAERSQRFVERGQLALGYALVAGIGLLIGAAGPITAVILGPQWDVAGIFALLAVAGVFQTLAFVGYWVYLAQGLMPALMRYSLISAALKVACIVVGSNWGLLGVAVGYALAPALSWPLSLAWLSRHSTVRVAPLYRGAGWILVVTAGVAAASAGVQTVLDSLPPAIELGICVGAGAAAYALLVSTIPAIRRDVVALAGIARTALARQK